MPKADSDNRSRFRILINNTRGIRSFGGDTQGLVDAGAALIGTALSAEDAGS
jgi:hypothetical protein